MAPTPFSEALSDDYHLKLYDPHKVAAVALSNKIARTIWALLVKGRTYQAPVAAGSNGKVPNG